MSQKIDGSSLQINTHLRSVANVSKATAAPEGSTRAVEATDSVRLTGEATSLQAMQRELSTAPAVDTQRVQQVREALENGTYRINPEAIAARMIELDQQLG